MRAALLGLAALAGCEKVPRQPDPVPTVAERCARLLPPEVANGARVSADELEDGYQCTLDDTARVAVRCERGESLEDFDNDVRAPVAGLGRAARSYADIPSIEFYASHAECRVSVTSYVEDDFPIGLAQAVDARLEPALAIAPPARLDARCDDVVPAATRARLALAHRRANLAFGDGLRCEYRSDHYDVKVDLDCGRGAAAIPPLRGDRKVGLVDGDTGCFVTVSANTFDGPDPDVAGVADEVVAALTPTTIR